MAEAVNPKSKNFFKVGGIAMAGMTFAGSSALQIAGITLASTTVWPIALGCVASGILLDSLLEETPYQKLFRNCGIKNSDGQLPIVMKSPKKDKVTTLVVHMPPGLSQKHFEAKQQELEQALNSRIEFSFNKNLIMKLTPICLSTKYDYIFKGCEKPLEVYCGETHTGPFILDITKAPHIIVAGETDSGKSSLLDIICTSLILNKHNLELRLIDFQAVTLGKYENCKKVKSYGETVKDFEKLMDEMEKENEKRRQLFKSVNTNVFIDKLSVWNRLYPERALPYIVVLIDEFARLAEDIYQGALEQFRTRVSMDRKVGVHYITAMQRPDVKCIEGAIKANMPCRIAFRVVTKRDSEVILDQPGAEQLQDQGRFLIKYCGRVTEVQGLYIDPEKDLYNLLIKHKAFKTKEDKEAERKAYIEAARENCINPYLKDKAVKSNENKA